MTNCWMDSELKQCCCTCKYQMNTVFREAGWRSPEEVNQRIDIILGLGEKKEPQ